MWLRFINSKKTECVRRSVICPCTHTRAHTHTVRTQTHPHMHASQVHRLTALSKKCFTDGSFPFFFRLTDLSTKLRWCPICLCTFKIHTNTHSHTLTYCLHKKTHAQGINSIKCLPFKFHFWSPWLLLSLPLSLWPHPDLSSCSPTSLHFLVLCVPNTILPTTSKSPSRHFFIFLAALHEHTSTLQSQRPCTLLCRAHPVQCSRWLSSTCMDAIKTITTTDTHIYTQA